MPSCEVAPTIWAHNEHDKQPKLPLTRKPNQTNRHEHPSNSAFDHFDLWLFDLRVSTYRATSNFWMCTKFGVDSSSRFFLERGHTDTHMQSQTQLITLPTHRLPPPWHICTGTVNFNPWPWPLNLAYTRIVSVELNRYAKYLDQKWR